MNYLDLFSGIGGFTLGLQQAGFKFDWRGHSEIDKYANQIYEKHYPNSEALGDVRTIKANRYPPTDLITFGFPCQDLSIAGKRGGLTAKRSSLFFEAMRIIGDAKPEHFIFENVKGLFSSNGGQDWLVVLKEIANTGYDGQWQLLNTRWFLPQNRERIYFIGHIRGRSRPKVFPIESMQKHARGNDERVDAQCYEKGLCNDNNNKGNHEGTMQLCGAESYLTPIECERLQGFPDNWTKGISNTQRYKCLGNAVSVPVVREIGKRLI